ncbi:MULTISPECIES: LysR substrate-binding domain-containing protein [Pseudomonas]|uniref:LysR substrate-binding domain-containing protein n=1 Tax=Pseudomonas TaxID=286 RepID=UPI000D421220|nr:LysR substrate-binding domain-containing protein [Pseudomonas putida]ELF6204303.1 LysR family transcriptional regulator [Pseudomonas putida]MCE0881721.1 LysR substrate-binding domain-containing protein [Pseudomonas putida]MDO1496928.1 LysR family transcriptional regulator [Pseudomonas putida]PTC01792.1 LysR family transcriptional regulator [Thalassospira xiamenensis]
MRQLRYFVAAAEHGQFSQAALKVHVSQSAITTAVSQLESILGVPLFERLPYGVQLTAEGHKFYRHARHILDTLQDAVAQPLFLSHALNGTVRVGASYTVLGYYLPTLLARFKRSYPQIEVDLVDMDRPSIEQGITDGSLDLGLTIVSNVDTNQLWERHVLMRSRRQLWLAPNHPLMHLEAISLSDIAEHAYILPTVDEGERSAMRYWRTAKLEPMVAFRTSSMEAVRGLVAHEFGVTILSDMLFRPWSLEGRKIEARPITDAVPPMELGLIWRIEADLKPEAVAFQQFLISANEV